jgi:hypothetical protein
MDSALEHLVWQRAHATCEYCHVPQDWDTLSFQVDHIIARKHRGPTIASNLALACFACNHHMGPNIAGLDPATGKLCRLFNPRRHKWEWHFRWDGAVLIGRTPIGRTTVVVLEVNLEHRIQLRAQLMDEGVFPGD